MADLSFTGTVSGLNHAKICARLRRMHQPWLMRWGILLAAALYFVIIFGLAILAATMGLRLPEWFTYIVLAIFFVTMFALLRWRRRHIWASVRDAPIRRAPQQYDLSPEGIRIQGEFIDSFLKWPAVLEVVEDAEGLLLLTGQLEYIVIPAQAFSDSDALRRAKLACEDWITAANAPI